MVTSSILRNGSNGVLALGVEQGAMRLDESAAVEAERSWQGCMAPCLQPAPYDPERFSVIVAAFIDWVRARSHRLAATTNDDGRSAFDRMPHPAFEHLRMVPGW
ncbi:MAG TPA: hypothetical protein VIQ53_01210, partial [Inquilinus sp.]